MTIYHDPRHAYGRPDLIPDLFAVPATAGQHQLENQATSVLAWLVDRSHVLARAALTLFLDGRPPHGAVGARTWVSLRKRRGGALYPDLSICVEGRALQLLVEVKVDSDFHVYAEFDGARQADVYRQLWRDRVPGDAELRLVGTLTRTGSGVAPDSERLVARDVSWRKLADAFRAVLANERVEPEVRLIAQSFVAAVDQRIAPNRLSKAEQAAFFADHKPLLDRVAGEVERRLAGPVTAKRIRGKAFRGWRLAITAASGAPLLVRLYLAAAGSDLNLPGAPDALIAVPERNPDGTLEPNASHAAHAAGFVHSKDLAGWWLHRRHYPLPQDDPVRVAWDITRRLSEACLVPPSRTP